MSPGFKSGLPLLELSVFVILVLMGWATFRLAEVIPRERKIQSSPSPSQPRATSAEPAAPVLSLPEVIENQDALKLREELLALADYVQANFTELESAFSSYVDRRTLMDLRRFDRKAAEFNSWLAKVKAPATIEQLDAKSHKLKKTIDAQSESNKNLPQMKKNWALLLGELEGHYTNYLMAAQYFINNFGKPLTGEKRLIDEQLARASQEALQVRASARAAREDGEALGLFLSARTAVKPVHTPNPKVEATAVQPTAPFVSDKLFALQYVYYTNVIALVALGFFLLTSTYRRMVVMPLRLKLAETNTIIEHQNKLAHFGQLLAGFAHEIRNPITAISARLYALQKSLRDGTPEHKDTAVIRSEINRLEQIVRDFLKLARPAEPRLSTVTAEPILNEVKELLAPDLAKDSIELKLEPSVETPFRADPQQLKQVLINLIQNAADSVGQNGAITLRARTGRARARENLNDAVVLEVEDTGGGIPPEVQTKVFDPFFSTKESGTGLGLPIAARIIDKHGGALEFESRTGKGTTFSIVLPACKDGAQSG